MSELTAESPYNVSELQSCLHTSRYMHTMVRKPAHQRISALHNLAITECRHGNDECGVWWLGMRRWGVRAVGAASVNGQLR